MKPIAVLISTPQDYEAALQIRVKVFVDEQKVPAEMEIDEFEKSAHHFIVKVDGQPAGCGRLRVKDSSIKFERIATLAKYRKKGVGRALMGCMQAYARAHYPTYTPTMHAQMSAIGFYETLGWVAEGEVFWEAGIPHRLLKRFHSI